MNKILAIYGSPREGRSDRALDFQTKGYNVERVYIRNLNIKPCSGCLECQRTRVCKIKDDMEKLIPILTLAPIIILSSPVYFKGLPSHLKAMIDRCQVLWKGEGIKKTSRGFFILTCEKKGDFPGCIDVIKAFFATIGAKLINGIILPSSTPIEKMPLLFPNVLLP